jgi:DNA repair exonuclease SbcCD ATPase subunit
MQSAKDLETELKTLEARRAELSDDVKNAGAALEDARAGLISGRANAPQVTGAQSTHTALSEALTALDARVTEKQEQLQTARVEEQRAADTSRAAAIRDERARLAAEVAALAEQGNEALRHFADAYAERAQQWALLRAEADAISDRLHGPAARAGYVADALPIPLGDYGPALIHAANIERSRRAAEERQELFRHSAERRRQREQPRGEEKATVPSVYSQTEPMRVGFYDQPENA